MNTTFLIQLMTIVFVYIILALSYFGIGWFGSHILKINFLSESRFFSFIWIGWAIVLLLLQVLNLFFPINAYSSIPFLIFGLILAIKFFKVEIRRDTAFSVSRIYLFLLIVSVFWIAILSMRPPTAYDSGLYHFNSVRWLNESPIVLGLGNLHGRLAFNQSFFVYVAYLNLFPLFNHGHNIANSFLILILLAECLFYLQKYIKNKIYIANFSTDDLVAIFFLPVIVYLVLYSPISSPTPDVASSVLQILIFIYFIRAFNEKISIPNGISKLKFILIISATAITVKLSNLFYAISICAIFLFRMKILHIFFRKKSLILINELMALPVLIIFIWSLRGIFYSGCPAYPSTIGCINTPWSVPIESVKSEANWVYSWARLPNQTPEKVLSSWDWLKPWFYSVIWENKVNLLIVVYPLLFFFASLFSCFILYICQPPSQKINKIWLLIPIPALIGLCFWFYLAPDIRFAHSLFWIVSIAAVILILKFIESSGRQKASIVLFLFFIANANLISILIANPHIFTNLSFKGYEPIPIANLTEQTTLSGLKVLVPTEGDQCWDSKIPCTPYFNPKLNFVDRKIFPEFIIVGSKK